MGYFLSYDFDIPDDLDPKSELRKGIREAICLDMDRLSRGTIYIKYELDDQTLIDVYTDDYPILDGKKLYDYSAPEDSIMEYISLIIHKYIDNLSQGNHDILGDNTITLSMLDINEDIIKTWELKSILRNNEVIYYWIKG